MRDLRRHGLGLILHQIALRLRHHLLFPPNQILLRIRMRLSRCIILHLVVEAGSERNTEALRTTLRRRKGELSSPVMQWVVHHQLCIPTCLHKRHCNQAIFGKG